MSELAALLAEQLAAAQLPADAVFAARPPEPGAPTPPEGPWLIVPAGAQFAVGALGRGKFAPYEQLWTPEDAVDLAVRLAATPLEVRAARLSDEELQVGGESAIRILAATEQRGGAAGPTVLLPGDQLDLIGPESAHHLYALGTPMPQRSQPPSDVDSDYFTFVVAEELPPSVMDGVAAPWFGQPGGGAMVVLDRPVRWYVDQGFLVAWSAQPSLGL